MLARAANHRWAIIALASLSGTAAVGGFVWWRSERSLRPIRAAFAESNWQRAYASAVSHLKEHPDRAEVHRIAAQSAARLGLWAAAEKHYAELGEVSGEDLRWRAYAALGRENWSHAAELLQKLLTETPDDAEAILKLAAIWYKDGHDVEATELAERAAVLCEGTPRAATAFSMLGAVHAARGNRTVAIDYLRRTFESDPEGTSLFKPAHELRLELARNLLLVGDAASARVELETLVRTGPESGRATVCYLLGRASWYLGDPTQAENCWKQAIERDAGHADALAALGELELNRQNADAAVQYLEAAVARDPKNVVAHYALSRAYFLAGDADAGRRVQETAVRLRDEAMRRELDDRMVVNHPDSPDTKAILAVREATRGNWGQAEQWAADAVRLAPKDPRWQRILEQVRARQVPESMVQR
jgi:tetratricopeptide (TPR) repeat protein